jgi:glycerate dehydrogenase
VVFLDAGTLPQRLSFDTALPIVYEAHQATADDRVAERIADADVVVTNWLGPTIRDVGGSVLGVVGRGRIGKATARLARGLGMTVLFASTPGEPCADDERELDELVREVDALTLHVPLTPQTQGLMSEERLAAMKPAAVLINTGRGALVDPQALANALRKGRIAGAAIDVLEVEPPPSSHPLLARDIPNLLLTPHVAWASEKAQGRLAARIVEIVHTYIGDIECSSPSSSPRSR